MSAPYLGDFPADQPVYFMYNTSDSDGASITRSTDGAVSVYKDNSDGSSYDQTQVTTGVTEDEDVDGLTGVHSVAITTTNEWYETGHDYTVVLSASTIDGQTVNAVLAHFSIENRYMRGTDGANTTVPDAAGTAPTAVEIQAEMEANGASILDSISDLLPVSTIAAATDIPAMVGTDNAALASVVGARDDSAADGDPTEAETLMQYVKQLINILVGSTGIPAFPTGAAPANGVSLAEVIRAVHTEVAKVGTIPALDGAAQTIGAAIAKLADDNGGADFDSTTDSLNKSASAAVLSDAFWDEDLSGHTTPGTSGRKLNDVMSTHYPNE